eukprot:Lithocolla_globosa_v1_NODE_41_length_8221_cov_7.943914.p1 type:complete len:1401 gc:universal NODE_41_length_8221_cov_7.943914:4208-6(-)
MATNVATTQIEKTNGVRVRRLTDAGMKNYASIRSKDVNRRTKGSSDDLQSVGGKSGEQPGWINQQKKAFTRWCNSYLRAHRTEKDLNIEQLESAFSEGAALNLVYLLEVLSGKTLKGTSKKAKMKIQKIMNIQIGLDHITKTEKIRLNNIGAEDLYANNLKLALGLIWTLILFYQIKSGGNSAKGELLEWCNKALQTQDVPEFPLSNFTHNWKSGKAFKGLVHYLNEKKGNEPIAESEPLETFWNLAEQRYGIPKLLDWSDMDEEHEVPDELSVMTYVSFYKRVDLEVVEEPEDSSNTPNGWAVGGDNYQQAQAGQLSSLWVTSLNEEKQPTQYKGKLSAFLELEKDKTITVPMEVTCDDAGKYDGKYTPKVAGEYLLKILWNKKAAKTDPYKVEVSAGAVDASKSYAVGEGVEKADPGKPAAFAVHTMDSEGNPCSLSSLGQLKGQLTKAGYDLPPVDAVFEEPKETGVYQGQYTTRVTGVYKLKLTIDDKDITGSPFQVSVKSGQVDGSNSIATGPGTTQVCAGQDAEFTVTTRDDCDNVFYLADTVLTLTLFDADGEKLCSPEALDQNNGNYQAQYLPQGTGPYKLEVLVNDVHAKGSPYHVASAAGALSPGNCVVKPAEGVVVEEEDGVSTVVAPAGSPTTMILTAYDRNNNPVTTDGAKVTGALRGVSSIDSTVTDNHDGTYALAFTPTATGMYTLNVEVEEGEPVGSPAAVRVTSGPPDAPKTTASGGGLNKAVAGGLASVTVSPNDTYGNPANPTAKVEAKLEGPDSCVADVAVNEDDYSLTYTPTKAGEYKLHVTLDGNPIDQSPFPVVVLPGAAAGKDAKVEGEGSSKAVSGEEATFTVTTVDASGNPVFDSAVVVSGSLEGLGDAVAVTVGPGGEDGKYTCTYTPTKAGSGSLFLVVDGASLAPYPVAVSAGPPCAEQSRLHDSPVPFIRRVGEDLKNVLQGRDKSDNVCGDNPSDKPSKVSVKVVPDGDSGGDGAEPVVVDVKDNGDGTFAFVLDDTTPTKAGDYLVHVDLDDQPVQGSPFALSVRAGLVARGQFIPEDKVPSELVAGELTNLQLVLFDDKDNQLMKGGEHVGVTLKGPKNTTTAQVTDGNEGIYEVAVQLTEAGSYTLVTEVMELGKSDSTPQTCDYPTTVVAGKVSAGNSLCEGPGTIEAIAGEDAVCYIQQRDQFGNESNEPGTVALRLEQEGVDQPIEITKESSTGYYDPSYVLEETSPLLLHVTLGGEPVAGSPFNVSVRTGPADGENTVIASTPNEDSLIRNKPGATACKLQAKDKNKHNKKSGGDKMKVKLCKTIKKEAPVVDNGDGTYDVKFPYGLEAGDYTVDASCGDQRLAALADTVVAIEEPEELDDAVTEQLKTDLPNSSEAMAQFLLTIDPQTRAAFLADLEKLKA